VYSQLKICFCNIEYFSDRGYVYTLHTLYVYATELNVFAYKQLVVKVDVSACGCAFAQRGVTFNQIVLYIKKT